ncbi:SNARE-binding exocyst subunit S6 [Malassezia caprae]|uniref:SNARE-binding exocyst subunit S6 n=1 Tax=Malassezia caprae TaxID=1381934 RepID=A0AAF0E3T9_9BASI|nr:SNARE-binding exocyst subunit S6 [Malassezia caprae]
MASGVGNLLADYLKSPDDLAKIPSLQRKLAREHASLSAKLKMGAKDQLEMTREGLLQLHSTRREIAGVQEKFSQIESMFQDTSDGGHGRETRGARSFRVISELSRLRRTLVQTSDLLTRFGAMEQDVQKLSEVLARYRADLLGPAPELLALHFQLAKWETFRNETLHLAGSSAPDTREQLISMLAPLEELLDAFEAYMLALFVNVLALVQRGQSSVVVRMAKIMERENREDERTAAIRLAKHAKIEGAARFHGIATYGHSIKLYWHKFRESLQMSALRRLQGTWSQLAQPSPRALCEQSSWLYDELEQVRRSVVPLFPGEVQVHKIYVQAHHRALGELLQTEVPLEEADAASLLELYHVAQEHEARLTRDGQGIDASWLEPSLLGGREQSIIDDYAGLLTRKMDDWTANLMYDEISAFVQREKAPDETAEGTYQLSTCVILFRMLNQQMDLAQQTGSDDLFVRMVDHACVVMHNCQSSWMQIVQQEFKKQTTAKRPEDVNGGLVEYLIALANDQLASADESERLLHRLEKQVGATNQGHVREVLDHALNGFLDISKHCVQLLVEMVLFDLRPAFKDLFTFPAWYIEGTTAIITETVRDYAGDYAARLEPNLYDVLSDDLITRLLTAYLTNLYRSARLRMPKAAERFKVDISELENLVSHVRSAEEAASRMEVLHMIHAILSAPPSMVFLPYWTFAKAHGPNLPFFEALLRARDDMEKGEIMPLLDSAKRKVQQEQLPDVPPDGPTIMTVVAQTPTSGFSSLFQGWPTGPDSLAWSALAQSAQTYLGAASWRRDA